MESKNRWLTKLDELGQTERDSLTQLFANCPEQIFDAMQIVSVPREHNLIEAGTPCNFIYIILKGKANGIDYQISGNMYMFVEFTATEVLGDYEILGDISEYRISIRTAANCELAVIPAGLYLDWMRRDANALFIRTRNLMNRLTIQTSETRKYLFLSCKDRLILYLVGCYKRFGRNNTYKLAITQSELAERTGFTVRTLQRTMAALEKEGMIQIEAGKISITLKQYGRLQQYTEHHFIN